MCRSFGYCTGLNAVTKILHKKPSKQEAKPKYYVLMYLSGQRQVILSALFTNYHGILMMWGICQVTCTCSSP